MSHRHRIALPYAEALYDQAESKEMMRDDLLYTANTILDTPNFSAFLAAPQITIKDKENLLKRMIRVNPLLMNLMVLLLYRDRMKYIPEIARAYLKIYTMNADTFDAHLISAAPLEEETKKNLQNNLERRYNKKISMSEEIDPSILGGFIVYVNNQIFDGSIKGKFTQLKEQLLEGRI